MATDMSRLIRELEKQGAKVSRARNGHLCVVNPCNGRKCQIAATPSDVRGMHNAITRLRRIGLLLRKEPV
jgi:hypothetical protein